MLLQVEFFTQLTTSTRLALAGATEPNTATELPACLFLQLQAMKP